MTQSELFMWGLASIWGAALGYFYFGGLWWTVRSLPRRSKPRSFLALSFIFRTVCVLLGFWLVLRENVGAFFFTIGAFIMIRFLLVRKIGVAEHGESDAD